MSHASAIIALKRLMKTPVIETDPIDHVRHLLKDESDRSTLILHAALIEAMLVDMLKQHMPGLNSDEQKELFDFEGPIGSFSNRIRMAHALGLISRSDRKKCDLLRVMRNVCVHSHERITFRTPAVMAGIASLFGKPDNALDHWDRLDIRMLYGVSVNYFAHSLVQDDRQDYDWAERWKDQEGILASRQKASL